MIIVAPDNTPAYLIQQFAQKLGLEVNHKSPEKKELVKFGEVRRIPRASTQFAMQKKIGGS